MGHRFFTFFGLFLLLTPFTFGQIPREFTFGFHLTLGATQTSVTDDLTAPSSVSIPDDGATSVEENGLRGRNVQLEVDYALSDFWGINSGLLFTHRRLSIRNQDGDYLGTSVYYVNYLSIPILARYESNLLGEHFHLNACGGLTVDIRRSESVEGSDFAHFMNLAQNMGQADARSRNGNGTFTHLFSNTGMSAYARVGLEYLHEEKYGSFAGLTWQRSLSNVLSADLNYNDADQTPISDTMKWNVGFIGLNLGIRLHM